MSFGRIAGLVCLVACAHAPEEGPRNPHAPRIAHYTVTIFDNLGGARVRACFKGANARELVPIDDSAAADLRGAWIAGAALETTNGRIPLNQASPDSCVDYETRFRRSWFQLSDSPAQILSQRHWLWRPEPFPRELDTSVRFVLREGGQVSLPWPHSNGTYQPDESVFFTETYGVFGVFDRQAFSVANTSVEVVRLGGRPSEEHIRRWLGRAMQVVASVGGRFPRERIHYVIAPVERSGEPVVFGMVRRGGGSSILLLPSSYAGVAALEADWVAVHELSHLWLPRLRSEDRWLSEGIATYLQEVLRARCGLQSSERAWTRLEEGFERGRRSGTGRRLSGESLAMNRTGAYQRVYWAGTAFALETDVLLRQRSNGHATLLTALSEAQQDRGVDATPVSASAFLKSLERATGVDFIEALGDQYAASSSFPGTPYLDSPDYSELRAEITSHADEACGINAVSSR